MARVKKEQNTKELLKELEINKKDLVNEIRDEVKDGLQDEIISRIDYEAKNKLDKMEKRIYKYKNRAIFKRNIIIILLIVLVVFETKLLYDNNLILTKKTQSNNNVEIVENKDSEEIKKDSKWYIENYSYLYNNIKTNLSAVDKYYLFLNNYNTNTIRNDVKLNMSYQLLSDDIKATDGIIRVTEDNLKKSYQKIFGNLDSYLPENFYNDCVQYIYNKDSKSYIAIDIECEDSGDTLISKIKDIYEQEDRIVIEIYAGIYSKDRNLLSNIIGEESFEYTDGNISNLKIYKFKFKKIDDEYFLDEIIRPE